MITYIVRDISEKTNPVSIFKSPNLKETTAKFQDYCEQDTKGTFEIVKQEVITERITVSDDFRQAKFDFA
jgi:hypothetical protein